MRQMNATSQTRSPLADAAKRLRLLRSGPTWSGSTSPRAARSPHGSRSTASQKLIVALQRLALLAILGLSAAMNTYHLSRNGWANNFYSAGVKSMLLSLHNFLFISFDPGGLISIDKPPLSVWAQAISAKLFGFTPLALLLPEAIAGTLCVGALYLAMAKPFGRPAALLGALCLAVFPAFVAVSRDNNPDALLILLMTLSCWVALLAIRSGRLSTLVCCAVLVGLAFNTKALAAYLVVPGIALGYVVCAPGSLSVRVSKLIAAGLMLAVISLAWLSFVDATPASRRPFVGSSKDNSELGLTFAYNGLGRVGGQTGGPGSIPAGAGAHAPLPRRLAHLEAVVNREHSQELAQHAFEPVRRAVKQMPFLLPSIAQILGPRQQRKPPPPSPFLPDGRARKVTPFGSPPGPLRLLEESLGGQAGWLLPLSLGGLLALVALLAGRSPLAADRPRTLDRRDARLGSRDSDRRDGTIDGRDSDRRNGPLNGRAARLDRRDGRLAGLLVLGGWFATEAAVLSLASGIVHPYYTSALAPGAAAMAGAGVIAFAQLLRRDRRWAALVALSVATTAATQILLLSENHYMSWLAPIMLACVTAGIAIATVVRRFAGLSLAGALAVLLIAPTAFAAATWGAPVEGTFPVAGPWGAPGPGGVGLPRKELRTDRLLLRYIALHHPTFRFSVLTVSSVTAAPMILMGSRAASLAGYSGTDRALSAGGLARLVQRHEARYVLLGGPYSSRGGNAATAATLKACRQIPSHLWGGVHTALYSPVLYDCAGRAQRLWAVQDGRA